MTNEVRPGGQVVFYRSEDGHTKLDVRLERDTVWLSQSQLVELFGKAKGTISEHIKHVFEDGELDKKSVVRSFRTTALDGKQYDVAHYNLDMVLALGFRDPKAWATPVAIADANTAAATLRKDIKDVEGAYTRYRATPFDADAHEVGDSAELAFRNLP